MTWKLSISKLLLKLNGNRLQNTMFRDWEIAEQQRPQNQKPFSFLNFFFIPNFNWSRHIQTVLFILGDKEKKGKRFFWFKKTKVHVSYFNRFLIITWKFYFNWAFFLILPPIFTFWLMVTYESEIIQGNDSQWDSLNNILYY